MQEQGDLTVRDQQGQKELGDRNLDNNERQQLDVTERNLDTTEQGQRENIGKHHYAAEQGQGDAKNANIDFTLLEQGTEKGSDPCSGEQGPGDARDKAQTVGCENESLCSGEQGPGDARDKTQTVGCENESLCSGEQGPGDARDKTQTVGCENESLCSGEQGPGDARDKTQTVGCENKSLCSGEQGPGDARDKAHTVGCENESSLGGPTFDPPLYVQRYGFVRAVLEKRLVKSVVDFGSAQCKIITLLKTVPSLEKIAFVDKNGNLLSANKWNAMPLLGDYLHPRTNPLIVHLFEGSATMLDQRILGYEAATMIELIEHLYEDELSGVSQCVFGCLAPRLVIVTTPNSDFNQLFTGFQGMRHWDHKFEWSQQQFNTWCRSICEKFDYQVEITGIGEGPPGSEKLGFCSQAAVFTQHLWSSSVDPKGSLCYQLIQSKEFPFKKDNISVEDRLAAEVAYHLHKIARCAESELDSSNTVCVSLTHLMRFKGIQELCGLEKLRDFVSRHYALTSDEDYVMYVLEDEHNLGSDIQSDVHSDEADERQETCEFMADEESWD